MTGINVEAAGRALLCRKLFGIVRDVYEAHEIG